MFLDSPLVQRLIDLAIEEDLSAGDLASDIAIDPRLCGEGIVHLKEASVICGLPLIDQVCRRAPFAMKVVQTAADGTLLELGSEVASIQGRLVDLLKFERTILNFLQHLSGIATHTRKIVEAARATAPNLTLLDTRKTTPGLRLLEKYAVTAGGARNHRLNLSDVIMIKNNHIDGVAGDLDSILKQIFEYKPFYTAVEVEVRDIRELESALRHSIHAVMLDNMSDAEIAMAVKLVRARAAHLLIEVSGRVTPERFRTLGELGVDAVSMSALVHGATRPDISMRIRHTTTHI
jgi:nicotinate-nucleotide pyrophosphorylase (carboxylating)